MHNMRDLSPQRLRRLRRLAIVPRWVVVPTIQKQSVAEHSYAVAFIALWVAHFHAKYNDGSADDDLMYYAIIHDETESVTGDIPSPAGKIHIPGKSSIYEQTHGMGATTASDDIRQILKIADLLEAYLFVKEDERLGNKNLDVIATDIHRRLSEVLSTFPFLNPNSKITFISEFFVAFNPALHPVLTTDEMMDNVQ